MNPHCRTFTDDQHWTVRAAPARDIEIDILMPPLTPAAARGLAAILLHAADIAEQPEPDPAAK